MRYLKFILLSGSLVLIPLGVVAQPLHADFIADRTTVCSGSSVIFTDQTTGISGATPTYNWSFGTGANPSTATGIGPHTVIYNGSGNATVSLTVTDGINTDTETKSNYIRINPLPTPTITGPSPVCAGSTGNVYTTQAGMSNYLWVVSAGGLITGGGGPGNNSVTVTWNTAGSRYVSVNYTDINGCSAASPAVFSVTVNSVPTATASNNSPVCSGATLSLTGGPPGMIAYSWSGPLGFSNATMSPVVSTSATVAMAGTYSLTVTSSNGCQGIASTVASVIASPVATASNNGPICAGSPLILSGGPSGMTSYSWSGPNGYTSNLQNPTVSLTATTAMAGTYILTVVNSSGCQNSASTTVVVNNGPTATASNNGPVCSGTPLSLTGGPAGMATYSWTGPAGFTSSLQSPVISMASTTAMSGIYTLTVTDNNGCRSSATTTAVVIQSPVATALNNGPVCAGTQLTLTGGPAGMTTYSWTGPNSFTSPLRSPIVSPAATLQMAGVYTLTVTNSTGCRDTATTRVNVFEVPVSDAGTGGTECDLNFVLNAVPSVGTGLWTRVTGPGTAVFTPSASTPGATVTVSAYGTYTFRWTETNGPCISSSVVTVNFYQSPLANAGPGGDACDLIFTLNAVPSSGTGTWTMTNGTGTATFTPNANSPSAVVTVSEYGTKQFEWKEVNGLCSDSSSVTVNFYQQPLANAGSGGNNCGLEFNLNATPSIGVGTWTRESGPGSVTFIPNANNPAARVIVTAYGTHVFRWTEVNGTCTSIATVSVTFIQQPAANAGNGGHECDLNFVMNATPSVGVGTWTKVSGPGNVTFSPNANQYNAVVTVSQFGEYDFAWSVSNSICSSSDIIRVTFHDLPQISAGEDLLLCRGSSIQLNATGTGSFLWSPASPLNNPNIYNPVASPAETTTFTVTLTDQWGCVNSDQVNVEVRIQPVADAGPDQVLEFIFETNLEAMPLGSNQTGEWTLLAGEGDISDIQDPSALVSDLSLDLNSFIWTVTNGVCPVSSDTVNIIVNNLVIPTLITPNLDGMNDFFVIKGIESFGETTLTVFNRWGARVYENSKYNNEWDGVDDNENLLPEDTYFYIINTEKSRTLKGYVVIRR